MHCESPYLFFAVAEMYLILFRAGNILAANRFIEGNRNVRKNDRGWAFHRMITRLPAEEVNAFSNRAYASSISQITEHAMDYASAIEFHTARHAVLINDALSLQLTDDNETHANSREHLLQLSVRIAIANSRLHISCYFNSWFHGWLKLE